MQSFLLIFCFGVLSRGTCLLVRPEQRPNIVFLMTDALDGRLVDPESSEFRTVDLKFLHGVLNEHGANFVRSYSNNPRCVPSRSSMMTGRRSDLIGVSWNGASIAAATDGTLDENCVAVFGEQWCQQKAHEQAVKKIIPTAMHDLGYEVFMAGKWHAGAALGHEMEHRPQGFNATISETGFANPHICLLCNRVGDSHAFSTDLLSIRTQNWFTGPYKRHANMDGISHYGVVDTKTVDLCLEFIDHLQPHNHGKQAPFFLHCSLNLAHFPFVSNPYWFQNGVNWEQIKLPKWPQGGISEYHPFDQFTIKKKGCDFDPGRQEIIDLRATYYAMVVEADALLSRVWGALTAKGYDFTNTYLMHVSDHGELAWDHHQLWKDSLYEGSVRVPIQFAGPGVSKKRITHLTSLLDVFPTLLDMAREHDWDQHGDLSGLSLLAASGANSKAPLGKKLAETHDSRDYVISQYQGDFVEVGSYMFRTGAWKLVTFGHTFHNSSYLPPLLFNIEDDPDELDNVADSNEQVVAQLDAKLRELIDIDAVELRFDMDYISYLLGGQTIYQKEQLKEVLAERLLDHSVSESKSFDTLFSNIWQTWETHASSHVLPSQFIR